MNALQEHKSIPGYVQLFRENKGSFRVKPQFRL
jgi:hypothetical protein